MRVGLCRFRRGSRSILPSDAMRAAAETYPMGKLRCAPPRLARAPSRLKAAPKVAEGFYQSPEWKALVARRKLDGGYFAAKRRAETDGSHGRVILDHVRERKDGGDDLDPANTQWLTTVEHNRKTAKVKAERAALR